MITMVESNQSEQTLQQVMKTGHFDTTKLSDETAQVLSDGLAGKTLSHNTGAVQCLEPTEKVSDHVAIKDLVLDEDIAELILLRKLEKLQQKIASVFGWWYNSPQTVKNVVTNMCYQLGVSGFSKFKKTIYLLETEQYEDASIEMLDSLWAKQTPSRTKELSEALRSVASD